MMITSKNPFADLRNNQWFRKGLNRLTWHIENTDYEWHHQEAGKLPRIHQWRLYRFCVQDVILGLIVIRHQPIRNCLEVDVFLTASIPEYAPESGTQALALLMLSDCFKNGGSMEIRFTEHVEDKHIPNDLVLLARAKGIEFDLEEYGIITPREAKQLFIALTGFTKQIQEKMMVLEEADLVSSALICYAVHNGIWDRREVEFLLLTCPNPGLILGGQVLPEQRQLFMQSLYLGRAALMFGSLDRHLRSRVHHREEGIIHLEDDQRELRLDIDEQNFIVTFQCKEEDMPIPWMDSDIAIRGKLNQINAISEGKSFMVLVRAYDPTDMPVNIKKDIEVACKISDNNPTDIVSILVTKDFERLPEPIKQEIMQLFPKEIKLLVYPHFISALDEDVIRKLNSSKVMRGV